MASVWPVCRLPASANRLRLALRQSMADVALGAEGDIARTCRPVDLRWTERGELPLSPVLIAHRLAGSVSCVDLGEAARVGHAEYVGTRQPTPLCASAKPL